ncbi:hypothetical protein D0T08_07690 [Emticicia sp. C21]|nr:hypothetical protein D0T08_07690 [Emticicia sp. C21]
MVGIFLNEDKNNFQVPATKVESGKVTNTVGTFLNEDKDGFRVPATKTDSEKVTNMVGTFLNSDGRNNIIKMNPVNAIRFRSSLFINL